MFKKRKVNLFYKIGIINNNNYEICMPERKQWCMIDLSTWNKKQLERPFLSEEFFLLFLVIKSL
jgi:hypothetical protein